MLNPLNAELSPICHLLALLGAHRILHVSRVRVNSLFTTHRTFDGLQFETATASDETQTTEKRQANAKKLLILANCKYFRTEIHFFLTTSKLKESTGPISLTWFIPGNYSLSDTGRYPHCLDIMNGNNE
jgi:hypothetical protein